MTGPQRRGKREKGRMCEYRPETRIRGDLRDDTETRSGSQMGKKVIS